MSIYKPPSCHICYTVLFYLTFCPVCYLFCRLFYILSIFLIVLASLVDSLPVYVSIIHLFSIALTNDSEGHDSLIRDTLLTEGPVENWKTILDLNVLALSMCTKEAIQQMKAKGVTDGHIVHINR